MSTITKLSLALILLLNLISLSFAQGNPPPAQNSTVTTSSNTDSSTPSGATKGVNPSIGSYGGSNFDKVNLFSGNVSMSFPLASLTSRGGMSAGVVLSYNSKLWRVERHDDDVASTSTNDPANPVMTFHPVYDEPDKGLPQLGAGWTIHAGKMTGRQTASGKSTTCFFPPSGNKVQPKPLKTLTIFVFTAPDGTEYDFRDSIYDGEPKSLDGSCEGINREKKFVSKDGTFATFINDVDVIDVPFTDQILEPSGYVYLRDGTRFRIDQGRPTEQRDKNGNLVRYQYDGGGRLTLITDNMGRTITVSYGGGQTLATITIKGFNGADRVTTVKGKRIHNLLPINQQLNIDELFPIPYVQTANQGLIFNPKVVSEVILPDNHKWEFQYNSYGEVVQVKTPARGLVEYTMGPTTALGGGYLQSDDQIFRRVIERRTFPFDMGQIEGKVVYTDPSDPSPGIRENDVNGNPTVNVTEEELDPNDPNTPNKVITRSKHKFFSYPTRGLSGASARVQNPNPYRGWLEGKELETRQFDPDTNSVMRTSTTIYEQQAAVAWAQTTGQNDPNQPENSSRVKKVINELNDNEPGDTDKISKVDYNYDQYNNVINEKLTGYNDEVIREVTRSFVTNLNGINYAELNRDIAPPSNPNEFDTHLRSLVADETIKNGFGQVESKTVYEYDVYSGQFHAGLVGRTLTFSSQAQVYRSTSRVQRGNVTAVTAGVITPDTPATPGTPSTTFPHYDVLGNVVAVVGPMPNQRSETEYSADSQFAFPIESRQFVDGGLSGNRILTSSREFDFQSGLVKKSIGLNGEVTTFEYNDLLDRLTREVRPQSSGISLYTNGFGTTAYTYSLPEVFPNTVSVQTTLDSGRLLESTSEFDGFLRSTKQKRTDPDGDVFSQTTYDATGRVSKVTNPFRLGEQADTEGYTTSEYDPLDRVKLIKTFDRTDSTTGTVTTNYSTNQVTVTDQAGKKRKSITDAAGRLRTVFEPDEQNNLTLNTEYSYDARSNLLQVNQGQQSRVFTYDPMSRLLTATSPESGTSFSNGTSTYQYDPASNLTLRTDPRSISTTYTYDSLNRLATKVYSDDTPDVSYFYDVVPSSLPSGTTLPIGFNFQHTLGRTTVVATPTTTREMATALLHTYDIGGRIARSSQLLDSQHYTTNSQYNEASLPTAHTYPSGRTIAHSYNIAGQITDVFSNSQPISQLATYTASGAIKSHQLGNGLHHQMQYNSRLQPTQITLGSGQTGQTAEDIWKQEYNYSTYDFDPINNATTSPTISLNQSQNNGNIGHIKLTPGFGTNPINQFFVYDELNRLKLAKEFVSTTVDNECSFDINTRLSDSSVTGDGGFDIESGLSFGNFGSNPPKTNASGSAVFNIDLTDPGLVGKQVIVRTRFILRVDVGVTTPNLSGSSAMEVTSNAGTSTLVLTASTDGDANASSNGVFDGIVGRYSLLGDSTFSADQAIGSNLTLAFNWMGQATPNTDFDPPALMFVGAEVLEVEVTVICPPAPPTTQTTTSWSQQYSYDRFGNRHEVQGTNSQILQISMAKNRITDPGYVYDDAGNLKSDPNGFYYFYDAENRLVKVALDDQGNIEYASYFYDANGWRIKKSSVFGTTRFVYDQGGRLLAEYDGEPVPAITSPSKENIYAPSGMLATVEPDKINYHTPDHLGSPRVLTDSTGAVISRRDFLPFGDQLSDSVGNRSSIPGYSITDSIRQKFTGYERDDETGLDFAQARYMSSRLGRFMTHDLYMPSANVSNPQTWNRYSYVLNNPLKYVDPDGLDYQHLSGKQKDLINDFFNTKKEKGTTKAKSAQEFYDGLTESQRSTYESVTHALMNTKLVDKDGKSLGNALDLVKSVNEIAGEIKDAGGDKQFRLYVTLEENAPTILDKSTEFKGPSGNKAGLHPGYPDYYQQKEGPPSGQISMRTIGTFASSDKGGDIDIDYRAKGIKGLFNGHLTPANSDVRAGKNFQGHIDRWPGLVDWWNKKK